MLCVGCNVWIGTEFFRIYGKIHIYNRRSRYLANADNILRAVEVLFESQLSDDSKGVDRAEFLAAMMFHFHSIDYISNVQPWLEVSHVIKCMYPVYSHKYVF